MEFVTTLGENKNYYDQQLMILQQKATELLATCTKRPLIALDLDYTVRPIFFSLMKTFYLFSGIDVASELLRAHSPSLPHRRRKSAVFQPQ